MSKDPPARAGLAALLPSRDAVAEIVQNIFTGPTVSDMIAAMRLNVGALFDEYRDLSVDGTVNVTQSILGDVPAGKKGATGNT